MQRCSGRRNRFKFSIFGLDNGILGRKLRKAVELVVLSEKEGQVVGRIKVVGWTAFQAVVEEISGEEDSIQTRQKIEGHCGLGG